MIWDFRILIFGLLCFGANGFRSFKDVQWLPCQFVDEKVHLNDQYHIETQFIYREAVIQFGNVGDSPLYPNITFLVTASKVDMRRYVEGGADIINCEIRRYSTGGVEMRWPTMGAQKHDVWFSCTLRHAKGEFVITSFLRHTPSSPARGNVDFLQWSEINDEDLLITSATMVVLTRTPSVKVGFLKEPTLHCQFAVDHKNPNVTVEWMFHRHGERTKLFSYSQRTGRSEGTGVSIRAVGVGNASYKLSPTRIKSEGIYVCSILIPPLHCSINIPLRLREPPRVSLNVESTLSLTLGDEKRIVCDAVGYYPLDVNIEWLREPVGNVSTSPVLKKEVWYTNHKNHHNGTYSLSGIFLLQPGLGDSGYKYTCRIAHKSFRVAIRKSFLLSVTEPNRTMWYIEVIGLNIIILRIAFRLLRQYAASRNISIKRF